MDENLKIIYFDDFEEYRKNNIFNISNILLIQYLNIIYPNLVLRENDFIEMNEPKSDILSQNIISNKTLIEKQISSATFSQYLGIQNLISERIFKYIDKSKKGKISKYDFCNGLYLLYFGNVSELSKLTFYICDFNDDGKIFKSDMKLILSYIPKQSNSNNSNQHDYIKQINKVINELFDEINSEEINYDFYLSKVTDGINNKNLNGAFFLFINLLKYLFLNKPFNKDNIDSVNFVKDRHLLKVSVPKGGSVKNLNTFIKKSLAKSEMFKSNINNNINNINAPIMFNLTRKKDKKYTDYKLFEKNNEGIGKVQKKDLFSIKKSSSTSNIEPKIQKKYEIIKHDFIMAKDKENIKNNDEIQNVLNGLDSKNTIKIKSN